MWNVHSHKNAQHAFLFAKWLSRIFGLVGDAPPPIHWLSFSFFVVNKQTEKFFKNKIHILKLIIPSYKDTRNKKIKCALTIYKWMRENYDIVCFFLPKKISQKKNESEKQHTKWILMLVMKWECVCLDFCVEKKNFKHRNHACWCTRNASTDNFCSILRCRRSSAIHGRHFLFECILPHIEH